MYLRLLSLQEKVKSLFGGHGRRVDLSVHQYKATVPFCLETVALYWWTERSTLSPFPPNRLWRKESINRTKFSFLQRLGISELGYHTGATHTKEVRECQLFLHSQQTFVYKWRTVCPRTLLALHAIFLTPNWFIICSLPARRLSYYLLPPSSSSYPLLSQRFGLKATPWDPLEALRIFLSCFPPLLFFSPSDLFAK